MRPLGRRPGIHNPRSRLWIPGSRSARPGMTLCAGRVAARIKPSPVALHPQSSRYCCTRPGISGGVPMSGFDRRAFLGMSAGAVAMLRHPLSAAAQTPACVPGGMAQFLPVRLNVDCASRRNFQLFRKYPNDLGLAGIVSMTFVRGKYGSYDAGSMIVFPWQKPKGISRTGAVFPTSKTLFIASTPIPDGKLPLDEYGCNYRLLAPANLFIGFQVDGTTYRTRESRFDWFTNVKLADGKSV